MAAKRTDQGALRQGGNPEKRHYLPVLETDPGRNWTTSKGLMGEVKVLGRQRGDQELSVSVEKVAPDQAEKKEHQDRIRVKEKKNWDWEVNQTTIGCRGAGEDLGEER